MKNENTTKELEKILVTYDKEFYYHILLLPEEHRKSLILLRSFNLELASIFAKASNVQAGMIRLEWWQDVILATNSPWRGEKIPYGLQDMISEEIHKNKLNKDQLLAMISARRLEFNVDNFQSSKEFYDHIEKISSPYFYHVFQALEIPINPHASEIIRLMARAWGITSILRGMAFFKEQNRSLFSYEQLKEFQIDNPFLIHHDNYKEQNKMLIQALVNEVHEYLKMINQQVSTYESHSTEQTPTYESKLKSITKSHNKQIKGKLKKATSILIFIQAYLKEIEVLNFNTYAINHNRKHLLSLIKMGLKGII